jgi:hypothetical protein
MWMEITGEDGQSMNEYITPDRIEGNYDFYATAITGYLAQMDYISKLVTIFSTIIQAAQILQLQPDEARKVLKKVVEAHGLKEINEILPDVPVPMMQILVQVQQALMAAMQGDPNAIPMALQMISQLLPQQGGNGGVGLSEPAQKPPNQNMAPENVSQMMTRNMGIGGLT